MKKLIVWAAVFLTAFNFTSCNKWGGDVPSGTNALIGVWDLVSTTTYWDSGSENIEYPSEEDASCIVFWTDTELNFDSEQSMFTFSYVYDEINQVITIEGGRIKYSVVDITKDKLLLRNISEGIIIQNPNSYDIEEYKKRK